MEGDGRGGVGMGGEGRGGYGRGEDRRGVLWTVESKKFLKIDPAPKSQKIVIFGICLRENSGGRQKKLNISAQLHTSLYAMTP